MFLFHARFNSFNSIGNYVYPDSYDMGKFSTSPFGDFVISPYSSGSAENLLKSLPEGQIFLDQGKKGFTPLFLTTKQRCEVGRAGFTMIEVIVATLIVAMLAAGVASAFWGAQHFLNRARHKIQAYNFAVEALDRLKSNYQYSSNPAMVIGIDHAQTEIDAGGILKGDITSFGGTLKYDVTEPQVNGYKQVTIKVHWNEPTF